LLSNQLINTLINDEWFNGGGNKSFSFEDVLDAVVVGANSCEIYVGADSNPSKTPVVVAVTIALITPSKGGNYYWARTNFSKRTKIDLYERLFQEAQLSCGIALKISERCPETDITVHLDVNNNKEFASGRYAQQFIKLVKAFGFIPIIKPRSWAASSIADKHAQ
jgi:predicted RNase H-related nuclease YkuK (DUF458 family)